VLLFRFKSAEFIHDFTSSGMIRNQDHITNRPHNGAFGTRNISTFAWRIIRCQDVLL
jgi:hypothetical protein